MPRPIYPTPRTFLVRSPFLWRVTSGLTFSPSSRLVEPALTLPGGPRVPPRSMRISSRLAELSICGWGAMSRALHYAPPKRDRRTSENAPCTRAQQLVQRHLYFRLLTQRDGEPDLLGIVTSYSGRRGACCLHPDPIHHVGYVLPRTHFYAVSWGHTPLRQHAAGSLGRRSYVLVETEEVGGIVLALEGQ
jgi:hypothetical protein